MTDNYHLIHTAGLWAVRAELMLRGFGDTRIKTESHRKPESRLRFKKDYIELTPGGTKIAVRAKRSGTWQGTIKDAESDHGHEDFWVFWDTAERLFYVAPGEWVRERIRRGH